MAAMVVLSDEFEVEVLPLAVGGFDFQANVGELKVTVDERDMMDRTDGRAPVLLVLAAVGTRLIAAITVPLEVAVHEPFQLVIQHNPQYAAAISLDLGSGLVRQPEQCRIVPEFL